MGYIAHIREKDGAIQTVEEHLKQVSSLAEQFGSKIGAKHIAGLAGLLHDLGKNSEAFKTYIEEAVANPHHPPRRGSVDHSTAGGKLLFQRLHEGKRTVLERIVAEWAGMCILSHHGGLRDFISPDLSSPYWERVAHKELPEFEQAVSAFFQRQMTEEEFHQYCKKAVQEVEQLLTKRQQLGLQPITIAFVMKYIFSCLIDADRTNTRMFEENEEAAPVFDKAAFFKQSYHALMKKISAFQKAERADHPINRLRQKMSDECEAFAAYPSGIYTLSIPTGGGKTLASLRYGLKHALTYQKDRIIYIVPYTTIIEQNAEDVRKILQNDEHILEHHSNVIEEREEETEEYNLQRKKMLLAKDNWDSPIIFTTLVQFLNVFYARGTRNVRRLHNLANAVLIFDEVQSVPPKCLSLFNEALNFLRYYAGTSIVLCTATQPALDFVKNKLKISTDGEMIHNLAEVSKRFKRVNIVDKTTPDGFYTEELQAFVLNELQQVNNILVILNTKTAVRKLYDALHTTIMQEDHDYLLFHLSTSMCPLHRKEVLASIKDALAAGQRVICVTTQLIEAGVDISFQCVVRSLAGLDSIAQAAGRCNRHGEDDLRNVYIIKAADEVLTHLPEIKIGGEKTERILREFEKNPHEFGNDLLSPQAMTKYFQYYYDHIKGMLDYPILELGKNAFDLLNLNQDLYTAYKHKRGVNPPFLSRQSFAAVETHFHVIDSPTTSVLVPYNADAKEIIAALNGELDSHQLSELLKKAQQYTVNVYTHELQTLDKEQYIDRLLHGNVYALKEAAYHKERGIDFEGEGKWADEIL